MANSNLYRAVRGVLLGTISASALLAAASPVQAAPGGDCLDAMKASGDPFVVGFANGVTPAGQLFCNGTQSGITVQGAAGPQFQMIFFGIGNETVNGDVLVPQGNNLGNIGFSAAPAAVQAHLVAFNLAHGLPATFPSLDGVSSPGGLVIVGSTINGAINNAGTLTGNFLAAIGSIPDTTFPATDGMFITTTTINGPTAGIINSGSILATTGSASVATFFPSVLIPTKVTGINYHVSGTFAGTLLNSGAIVATSVTSVSSSAVGIEVSGPGTFAGSINNTGSLTAIAPSGGSAVGIMLNTPVGGGVFNNGDLITRVFNNGSPIALGAAIDDTLEGGASTITQAGGSMVGSVHGSGTDLFHLIGGSLMLDPTSKVNGLASFTQSGGGTLALNVGTSTLAGTFPTVSASSITLGGTLLVVVQPADIAAFAAGKTFADVFVSSSAITGSFSSIDTGNPLLTASVTPDPNTANALDLNVGLNQSGLSASMQTLAVGLSFALDQPQALIDTVQERLLGNSAYSQGAQTDPVSPAPAQLAGHDSGAWVRGYGLNGGAGAKGAAPAFSEHRSGVTFGIDWKVNGVTIGVAGDYAHTNVPFADGSDTALNSFGGLVYAGWRGDQWYATGGAGAASNSFSMIRSLAALGTPGFAASRPSGQSYAAYGETGYAMPFADGSVAPFGRLDYVHANTGAFAENGPFGSLDVNSTSNDSFTSALGVRASTQIDFAGTSLIPQVRVAWQHEFWDSHQNVSAALVSTPGIIFTANGPDYGRNSALLGAGVIHYLAPNAQLFAEYDGKFTGGFHQHAYSLGVKVWF